MALLFNKFKQLDAYAKTLEDFRVKTATGAFITVISSLVMVLLILSELHIYMSPNISEELFVDVIRAQKLHIDFDITFPKIGCDNLFLHSMDSSGEQHHAEDHNIRKQKLNSDGVPIVESKKMETSTSSTLKPNITTTEACGGCYGAESDTIKCCNTCEDIKIAYKEKRWSLPDLKQFQQCQNHDTEGVQTLNDARGCRLYGLLKVDRVGGSFHISPGKGFTANHVHSHNLKPFSTSDFNTTHIINNLAFGANISGGSTAPLNGIKGVPKEGGVMFTYYLKIVPTMYVDLNNTVVYSNQFSATRHQKRITSHKSDSGTPGTFFNYELSPLTVKYTEKERSIGHFATNVCAIVGGVFTLAGIFDTLLYHSLNTYEKKFELGKTG